MPPNPGASEQPTSLPDGRQLVLASTSTFRRSLLQKLELPFITAAPEVDENRLPDETPEQLVNRLSEAKARAVAEGHPNALIIGSDQIAILDGEVIGKPGTHEKAIEQLTRASGRRVDYLTGLCLLDSSSGKAMLEVVPFTVYFRQLSPEQIEGYLRKDKPYHSAGSFKSEGLGIALFIRLEGEDPNTLIGLPLIRLTAMLGKAGIEVLQ